MKPGGQAGGRQVAGRQAGSMHRHGGGKRKAEESKHLMVAVIMTIAAVAVVAVLARSEAVAVELEALAVLTVAGLPALGRRPVVSTAPTPSSLAAVVGDASLLSLRVREGRWEC